MKWTRGRISLVALALPLAGCGGGDAGRPAETPPAAVAIRSIRLMDVTTQTGIDAFMTCGDVPSGEILDVNGGGLALLDYDDDGDLDLFVANGASRADPECGPGSRLYRNDGGLRFTDVTRAAGIALTRWAMGVAVADADGDGRDDLYVTCFGPNVLLRNAGDGTFEDVTDHADVGDPRWSTGSAFGDVDLDGDLDLYVANYVDFDLERPPPRARHKGVEVMNGPHGMIAEPDTFYENLGDGTFRDATAAAGCRTARPAYGLGVIILDVDDDGRPDILVGNDSMANLLFRNVTAPGDAPRFEEVGLVSGVATNEDGSHQATMGIAVADVTGNGRPDVFTTNFANDTNTLHANADGRFFDDRTRALGLALVSRPSLGWSCGFFDLDHDGDEDLLIVNGHVYPQATVETMDSAYEQPPLLFARDGRRFRRVTDAGAAGAWLAEPHRDRAAAFGDLDGDGDIDVVIGELNGPVRVLRNEAANETTLSDADWLIVELRDERPGAGNHRGLGSRIELESGDHRQVRWIYSGGGFQSASAPAAHFGLPAGAPTGTPTVTVTWPDGTRQRMENVAPGDRLTVRRVE